MKKSTWTAERIARRYDLAILSTKGMSVVAARQLVERLSEQGVTILVFRDFDKAGFSIVHTLRTSGRRYKFRTEPNVIDLGLRLEDVGSMGLEPEAVEYDSKVDPRASLLESGATDEEANFLRSGGTPRRWTGERVELNAMNSPQFIEFLEKKLEGLGVKKVVPKKDVLEAAWRRACRITLLQKALDEAERKLNGQRLPVPEDLGEKVSTAIEGTGRSWDTALSEIAKGEIL